jgi:hypothetical protein
MNGLSSDTGSIEHNTHSEDKQNKLQKTNMMINTDPTICFKN